MKYLKRIFESTTTEELQDFCETNLAYLLDDGEFDFPLEGSSSIFKNNNVLVRDDVYGKKFNGIQYMIHIKKSKLGERFKWIDVKEHIIPFLHVLNREYRISRDKIDLHSVSHGTTAFIVDRVLKEQSPDRIYFDKDLFSISIGIK
jgi:hypothetical protein